jgi:shikimate kinase
VGITLGHIFLYGPPASGKSTIGKTLAENLNLTFVDLDDRIKQTSGTELPKLMVERGESGFRDLEAAELEKLMTESDSVVALGGGTLLRNKNRVYAESCGPIFYLDADIQTLLDHLAGDNTSRPLLAGDTTNNLKNLLTNRASHYDSFQTRIRVDGMTPEQITWQIRVVLGQFYLRSMGAGYRAIVRSGGVDSLGEILRAQGSTNPIIVTDVNVAKLYEENIRKSLRRSEYTPSLIRLPAGEFFKTLDTINILWRNFLDAGLDRASTVVALGGGVVGDMAGFAAATFMRGIDWVCIPSTLLSMVDASLGGKTGFDLPEGKNLIGNFHPPRLVLADPQMLATLPMEEFRSGMAEVVKHGIIADPDLFNLCSYGSEAALNDLPQIVRRAMAVKIKIIEDDPYEKGSRAALNLGTL